MCVRSRRGANLNVASNNFSHDNPFPLSLAPACCTTRDLFIFPLLRTFSMLADSNPRMCLNLLSQFKHFFLPPRNELFIERHRASWRKHFRSFVSTGKFLVSFREFFSLLCVNIYDMDRFLSVVCLPNVIEHPET